MKLFTANGRFFSDRHRPPQLAKGKIAIMKSLSRRERWTLIIGDFLTFVIITVFGFASHEELDLSLAARMLATFFPFCIAWFLIAPWLGLFHDPQAQGFPLLWRTPLGAVLAAPFGAWLRMQ